MALPSYSTFCTLSESCLADIVEIEQHSNRPPWNEDLIQAEFQNRRGVIYGIRQAARVVAFLICHVVLEEAHIVNFAVAPESRRKGLGGFLLRESLRELYAHGVQWVTLEVRAGNLPAYRLYEALGFSEVGIRERYYADNQEDALILKLNLMQFIYEHGEEEGTQSETQEEKN